MRALAKQRDANAVARGKDRSHLRSDLSGRVGKHVLRERNVGLGYTIAQSTVDHRFGAARHFFSGLKQGDEVSFPRLRSLGQQLRATQETRHMRVMAARM